MPFSRVVLVITFVVTWFAAVWHGDLEANGWMFAHHHGEAHAHSATGGHHSHPVPGDEVTEHEEVFARIGMVDVRLAVTLVALLAVGLFATRLSGSRGGWPRLIASPPRRDRARREAVGSRWLFVWRCASFSTAPPAVN